MRNVKLYIAQSLDGFIATNNGSVDWLNDQEMQESGSDYGYSDFYKTIDTTLMGYNTYREILSYDVPFPYPDKQNYVFSRKHVKNEDVPVEFVSSNITKFVSDLKKKNGKDIWLIGGGEINKQLLNADLIDEIILTVKSVVLGQGIPLFGAGTEFSKFKFSGVNLLHHSMAQLTLVKDRSY